MSLDEATARCGLNRYDCGEDGEESGDERPAHARSARVSSCHEWIRYAREGHDLEFGIAGRGPAVPREHHSIPVEDLGDGPMWDRRASAEFVSSDFVDRRRDSGFTNGRRNSLHVGRWSPQDETAPLHRRAPIW